MNADLERLIELQQVDGEIATLKAEIAALPKHIQAIEAQLAKANKRVESAKGSIKANELARRNHEQEIQAENNKIIKFREQSSSVKTNEQYRALMTEIGFAEQQIKSSEDKILEAMLALDGLNDELKAAETERKADSEVVEKEKVAARAKTTETEQHLASATAKRGELRKGVDEDLLRHYDRVLKGRGTAIAEARDQRCMACQVMLRPQVFNEIRNGEVRICDSCNRILFVRPEPEGEPKAEANSLPMVEREWMFVPSHGPNGAFVIFVNSKGNATMKAYDAHTGAALDRRSEKNTTFQHAFAAELHNARNLFVDEPHIEERFKDQLPPEILEDLQHQIPSEPTGTATL